MSAVELEVQGQNRNREKGVGPVTIFRFSIKGRTVPKERLSVGLKTARESLGGAKFSRSI